MKITNETIQLMPLFEKETGAKLKDCFEDELNTITFIVEKGQIAKALGKGGVTLHKLQKLITKPFKIIEFDEDIKLFIASVVRPTPITGVIAEGTVYIMQAPTFQARGYLIGKNATSLRNTESILKRYFDITELKVESWEKKQAELTQQQN